MFNRDRNSTQGEKRRALCGQGGGNAVNDVDQLGGERPTEAECSSGCVARGRAGYGRLHSPERIGRTSRHGN